MANGTADQAAEFGLADLSAKLFRHQVGPEVISVERNVLDGASVSFTVARWGEMLAVVRGGSHLSGTDAVSYDAMTTAESRFTATVRSIFLPLMYEHIGGGGTPAA